ncbi:predicted protein [Thalassiosira pseudonana CCMP1335]|uniref:Uncharacterized protein n=1 Tax=Thalassiosira pseudonana TaxID=35128 RepID=B8LCA3_THAPS|nr:predicted protein [Thalassiosira pseudonana CCMP1335]EED87044.1 predicted protein [Thalassiosira pseudonana CCMP1335]|eukprot:g5224.t1 g5224   contig2:29864-30838(-)
MKSLTAVSAAAVLASAHAFTTPSPIQRTTATTLLRATLTADELATMSKEERFNVLGVEEEKLAMGIEPEEVLEFIGTKQDLLNKFQQDIPKFSPTQVEIEVNKFLMDGEMLDLYIKYAQRKAEDPSWEPQYAEEDKSPVAVFIRLVSENAIWIAAGILLKDFVVDYFKKGGDGSDGAGEVLVSSTLDVVHQISSNLLA